MKKSSFVAMILGTIGGIFFCAWDVHGIDTGVECLPAGSGYGRYRRGDPFNYGTCLEKDGK